MEIQKKNRWFDSFRKGIAMRLFKAVDILIMAVIFGIVWHNTYSKSFADVFYQKAEWIIIAMFIILYCILGRVYEGFRVSIVQEKEIVYSQGLSLFLTDVMLFLLAWLLGKHFPAVYPMLTVLIGQIILAYVWAYLADRLYYRLNRPKKTAVLYYDTRDFGYLEEIGSISEKFQIEKKICVPDDAEKILHELNGMETVFIRGIPSDERNTVLKYCIANQIEVYQYPKIGDIIMSGAEKIQLFHVPVMRVYRYDPPVEYLLIKRILDIVISLMGIVVLSPLFFITAAAVALYDGGSVLYRQKRLTQNGKEFEIYKFRSMRMDAEKDGIARLAQKEDSRITPVGKFIRAVRLDELPQLFNVLRGDMSLVGPRPERPEIVEKYMEDMPEFALRLQAKAGITGYAQIYGKYNSRPYDKLQMDLMYIAHPSILTDLKLIFATIKILFMKESTEGIEYGRVTAQHSEKEKQSVIKSGGKEAKQHEIQCGDTTL